MDTEQEMHIPDFYHAEPLEDIKGSILDFHNILREDLLLQIPQFVECNKGKCPERDTVNKYLKSDHPAKAKASTCDVHYPFSNL